LHEKNFFGGGGTSPKQKPMVAPTEPNNSDYMNVASIGYYRVGTYQQTHNNFFIIIIIILTDRS